MGSIWKAVTGFFKSKAKMDPRDTNRDEDGLNEDSDSDDEDFVPNEAHQAPVSEESDDGDDDETQSRKTDKRKTNGTLASKKRKLGKKSTRRGKRRKFDDEEDSEDDEDVNFTFNESRSKNEDFVEEKPSAEAIAAEDALEKAHTDKLWADFLTSVDEDKKKKKDRTVEKVVTKVYDFAGEKVEVLEKVKVTVSSDKASGGTSSQMNGSTDVKSSSKSTDTPLANGTPSDDSKEEPTPGTSSSAAAPPPKPKPRRGGISILGNDPETIGLDDLDKRGLSGLLKAFQTKARKIGTLEKSKLDWETYKRQQGMEDELQHHNKSKDTYIDKQQFLQRTDHRQFEIEKNMRATVRSRRLAN